MSEFQTGVDDRFVIERDHVTIAVSESNVVDERAGIGPRQYETQLTNHPVKHLLGLFDKLVRIDRKRLDVAVLYESLGIDCRRGLVEEPIAVNPVFTILENSMSEYVARLIVRVLPNQRNSFLILMLEGIWHDRPSVGALETGFGGVATKIWLPLCSHFERPSLTLILERC